MTSQATTGSRADNRGRPARGLAAIAGVGYTVVWVVSLVVGAPSPSINASGRQIVAAFRGHDWPAMAMFVLAEGVAAIALAIVMLLTAQAARRQGNPRAGLTAAGFGLAGATVSLAELAMGTWLVYGPVPSARTTTAGTLYHALIRTDGAKLLLFAGMGVALAVLAATSAVLPRWLAPLGLLLAASLVVAGVSYLLLAPSLSAALAVSLALLLVVVTATGVTLRVSR